MQNFILALVFILTSVWGVPFIFGAELPVESGPLVIIADRISRTSNPESIVAEGNVIITKKEGLSSALVVDGKRIGLSTVSRAKTLVIKGDWIRYEPQSNKVTIKGNGSLLSEDETVRAEYVDLDLDTQTGILTDATLYFPKLNLFLAGKKVKKTGELTYYLQDGWATKCAPKEHKAPPWSFGWQEANLVSGGFAHLKHITFRVKDWPLVYAPYFGFSTNKERRTGFLLPEISNSGRDGAGILVPFFVNLSPSHDLTLFGGFLAKRGFIAGAEFRYVLDLGSVGMMALNYFQDHFDDKQDDFLEDSIYRTAENRYWLRGKVDHELSENLSAKLDLDLVSDRDYLLEYKDSKIGFDQSNDDFKEIFGRGFESETTYTRSNSAQLSRLWSDMVLGAELKFINDTTDDSSTSHLWSLPKVVFSGRQPLFSEKSNSEPFYYGADLAWDSHYVYYWREYGVSSQRLDLYPQLVSSLPLNRYLETVAALGLRQTFYLVDREDSDPFYESGVLNRTLYDFSITSSTILMRNFSLSTFKRLSHMVRPELNYHYVPRRSQEKFPLLDDIDRIEARNHITYGLRNSFDMSVTNEDDGSSTTRKSGYFNLSQSYNLRGNQQDLGKIDNSKKPFSELQLESGFYPFEGGALGLKSGFDVYGRGWTKYELLLGYVLLNKHRFSLEYRYEKDLAIHQLNIDFKVALDDRFSLEGDILHSLETDKTTEASLGLFYNQECWEVEFLTSINPDGDYRFIIVFALEGIGKAGMSRTF